MPNLPLQYVTDKDGNKVWPITHIKAVRDDNGTSLSWLLASKVNTPSWRPVKVDNVEVLGTETTTNPLNLKAGEGISLDASNGNIEIALSGTGGGVVLQQDDNTDAERPVIIKYGTGTADVTERVLTCDGITVNPSSNSLSISGNLSVTGDASFGNNVTIEGYSAVHEGNTDNYVPKWFTGTAITGTGASISAVIANSKAGDMYLNTSTDNVYRSSSVNVWDYVCNIKGNTGATGPQGPQGATGATGATPTSMPWANITGKEPGLVITGTGTDAEPAVVFYMPGINVANMQMLPDANLYCTHGVNIHAATEYVGIYAKFFTTVSDRHLKKNITDISILSLEQLFDRSDSLLKKFTWRTSGENKYGLIAQEVENLIPEAVSSDVVGRKSIDYTVVYAKLFASLINEIKKLKNHVGLS